MADAFVTAKWIGREKVMERMRQLAPEMEKQLATKQLEFAKELADTIRRVAPIGTQKRRRGRKPGHYRRSINGRRIDEEDRGALRGIPNATKDPNATALYAEFIWRWLEFGSVNNVARPHIFPIYRAMRRKFKREMRQIVRNVVAGRVESARVASLTRTAA